MEENIPPPAASLQFDKAEYSASQPVASTCSACKQPITQTYYATAKGIICDPCRRQIEAFLAGGSRFMRVLAAAGLGLLAGLAGAAIWYAVRIGTGYEIGLIAVVVGVMVGLAVRKGSRGRGGWFYQTLAVVLTYSCISAQYMPDIFQALLQKVREQEAASARPEKNPQAGKFGDKASGKDATAEKAAPIVAAAPKPGMIKAILAIALILVVVFVMSLALPFLAGVENLIGLLIIGFALYEAWKINKGSAIRITGPFQLPAAAATGTTYVGV